MTNIAGISKTPEFMPCLGILSVYHPSAETFSVCSSNQLDFYLARGWKRLIDWENALDEMKNRGELQ
jgi:hypothetical protein